MKRVLIRPYRAIILPIANCPLPPECLPQVLATMRGLGDGKGGHPRRD